LEIPPRTTGAASRRMALENSHSVSILGGKVTVISIRRRGVVLGRSSGSSTLSRDVLQVQTRIHVLNHDLSKLQNSLKFGRVSTVTQVFNPGISVGNEKDRACPYPAHVGCVYVCISMPQYLCVYLGVCLCVCVCSCVVYVFTYILLYTCSSLCISVYVFVAVWMHMLMYVNIPLRAPGRHRVCDSMCMWVCHRQ
jgi:hypothetical protein